MMRSSSCTAGWESRSRYRTARTGATSANWIHVANSWVHDILPAARLGLRSVWVDRDHTGHPAKFAERRVSSMRRLPETVMDVTALPAWPAP